MRWSNFSGDHRHLYKDSSSGGRNSQSPEPTSAAGPSSSLAAEQGQDAGKEPSPSGSGAALLVTPAPLNNQIDRLAVRVGTSNLSLVSMIYMMTCLRYTPLETALRPSASIPNALGAM